MERTITLTERQRELIEEFGVLSERSGTSSPMEARILGLLVVSNTTELTFEEIYQVLQVSKSAASNAINRLLQVNKIEYITLPGDRKRYFRSRIVQWETGFKSSVERLFNVSRLMEEVLKNRPEDTKDFNDSLRNFIGFMEFMQTEVPLLYDKWKQKKG
jgi:DNA-binding transcriptional regulator GbsR (MarR family)